MQKKNNRAAQEELYNRFYKAMYHTAYHFVKDPMRAEDIMQEGFITAFEKLEQYQGGGTFWFRENCHLGYRRKPKRKTQWFGENRIKRCCWKH